MKYVLTLLAIWPSISPAMEEPSSNIPSEYKIVALSTENERAIFQSEKLGKVFFYRTGLYTKPISIKSDIFVAEEKPTPQLSPNGMLVAYVWKNNVYIFPWGNHGKKSPIFFSQKPLYLSWGSSGNLFVASQSGFCNCILNSFGEPITFLKGLLISLPTSEIYGIHGTTFIYQKSSSELILNPTKPDGLAIHYLFKKPIVLCSGENSTFACIDTNKIAFILNKTGTEWFCTQTSISEPSALAASIQSESLFIAIANSQSPYDVEIIGRQKDSDTEMIFETPSFSAPITKMIWTSYGDKNIVCVSSDGTSHTIATSNIFKETTQS